VHRCTKHRERGVVMVWVVVALIALLGIAALTVDVGQLAIAAQVAQDVADAAALGAGLELPEYSTAQSVALSLVAVNNESLGGFTASCSPDDGDVTFWGANETIPDWAWRVRQSRVVARSCVCPSGAYRFARCG